MRFFIAGILTLWLCAASALGQATGQVESVGFLGNFRPGCWTPMVIHLVPTTSSPFSGRIEVIQEDLDKDRVIFTRQFSLTGNAPDGTKRDQRFWMYMLPQPTSEIDSQRTLSLTELSDLIKVRIVSEKGQELLKLPITQSGGLNPIEPVRRGMSGITRGTKLVLVVNTRSMPNFREYEQTTGLNEDVRVSQVTQIATGLPDRVIGYDAIDAIVWTDADPMQLSAEQYKALQDYVARGGRLIVSQDTAPNQWRRNNAALAQLMPVTVEGVGQIGDVKTLRRLADVKEKPANEAERLRAMAWERIQGPYLFAVGEVKPGAFVVEESDDIAYPFIVRKPHGAGAVTWVAMDLGDRALLGRNNSTSGWPLIWDRICDWPNDPIPVGTQSARVEQYKPHVTYELGKSMLRYMDLPSTSAALVSIAVLFFIMYWVAAGPGSYLFLSKKGKATLSWFAFAGLAIAATGLTWVIVKLVLRGDAQLQHVSYVRMTPGMPAIVKSNFGLYIPRDGNQKIELKNAAQGSASYVTAFNLHPAFNETEIEFPAKQDYRIPVMEVQEQGGAIIADPKVVEIPYRSTLKKFQSQWVGTIDKGITVTDAITLSYDKIVSGRVRNDTGIDLRHVYLVFHHPGDRRDPESYRPAEDYVLYALSWTNGAEMDLAQVRPGIRQGATQLAENKVGPYHSGKDTPLIKGLIGEDRPSLYGWAQYWYDAGFRVDSWGDREWIEDEPLNPRTFPILSFYDRMPPARNNPGGNRIKPDRTDLLRRGVRHLDMSAAISGGNLAVIAIADGKNQPLPFPMQVHNDPVKGQGVTYYQFVLPIDRKLVADAVKPAATRPTTLSAPGTPTTRPAPAPAPAPGPAPKPQASNTPSTQPPTSESGNTITQRRPILGPVSS